MNDFPSIRKAHPSLLSQCPGASKRLVVPHEELWIFLEDVFGYLVGHGDNGGVIALLPCLLAACAPLRDGTPSDASGLTHGTSRIHGAVLAPAALRDR